MALRLRPALLFAAATAVLVAVAGFAFVLQLRVSVDASLDPGLRARVATLGDDLDSDGALPPPGIADTLVQARSPTGQLLAATPEAGSRNVLDAAQFQQTLAGEVSFTGTDCPPELDIEADPDRLRQAIDNLLDNATRHTPDGSTVGVTASILREGLIAVDVSDRSSASRRSSCLRHSTGSGAPRPRALATAVEAVSGWQSGGPSPRRTGAPRAQRTERPAGPRFGS